MATRETAGLDGIYNFDTIWGYIVFLIKSAADFKWLDCRKEKEILIGSEKFISD